MPNQIRIGADIGGTFTDIVFLDGDGSVRTAKVSSTPDDYARAISDTVAAYLADTTTSPAEVVEINHGTTVATNAILERKGARVGLLTTEGFRDVLEIRRVRLPVLYDLEWENRRRWCRESCGTRSANVSDRAVLCAGLLTSTASELRLRRSKRRE